MTFATKNDRLALRTHSSDPGVVTAAGGGPTRMPAAWFRCEL